MKNILKLLMLALIVALSITSCSKDKDEPLPPKPQPPAMSISASEISLMPGMIVEVGLNVGLDKVNEVIIEGNQEIASLSYDPNTGNLKVESKATTKEPVLFKIIDKADKSRSVELKVTVKEVSFGIMNPLGQEGAWVANYRYQTQSHLYLAPSGAMRKDQFLKIPIDDLKLGEDIDISYKKANEPHPQILKVNITALTAKRVYLKTNDGKYIIFPIHK